jgi:hypothetical protein
MERRSQKQSALTQLAKKGILTTKPTPTQRALATLSSNIPSKPATTAKASAGRRKHRRNKKTHKKNRKSYF